MRDTNGREYSMKKLLMLAGFLAVSGCVMQPTTPPPSTGDDPALEAIPCVDASGNFAPCE
jgi:uncharacterized lipoprotein YajG